MKKRDLCINDARDRNKWRRCCTRVFDPGYWEEDPAIKAEWRRSGITFMLFFVVGNAYHVGRSFSTSFLLFVSIRRVMNKASRHLTEYFWTARFEDRKVISPSNLNNIKASTQIPLKASTQIPRFHFPCSVLAFYVFST